MGSASLRVTVDSRTDTYTLTFIYIAHLTNSSKNA